MLWPKGKLSVETGQTHTTRKPCCVSMISRPSTGGILRTTNPIESTFAQVRARTDITKGPGSREAGLAMIYKLLEAAEGRWRRLNGSHLVSLVRAGAKFENGELVEGNSEEKDAA